MIEREDVRAHASEANPAVGGLEADDATQGGGLADRTARIGAERDGAEPRGDRCRRAAARAPGDALEPPRIVRRAIVGIDRRGGRREFVGQGLAKQDGTSSAEAGDAVGICSRDVVTKEA